MLDTANETERGNPGSLILSSKEFNNFPVISNRSGDEESDLTELSFLISPALILISPDNVALK